MSSDLPESGRNYLRIIRQSGEDISQIVARMREFYRRRSDTEQLVNVNINHVIEEVVELTRPRWRDLAQRDGISIDIKRDLAADLPRLLSDSSDLREALTNLVFNAVDALPHGGTITLATRSFTRPPSRDQSLAGELLIGMDEKTRQRCLEPFFSTKAKRGGTGLGLAMVYGMMQRHEGTIDIESAPGRGSTVRLTFPLRESTSKAAPAAAAPVEQRRSLRILCIDDEPQIQKLLSECLSMYDHKVATASGGRQGIEMFREAAMTDKPFQTVITDLGMPDVDGHQVVRTIKAESPNTPIVMITGWGTMMKEDGEEIPEVDALVGKPPSIKKLNELLLQLTAAKKT